MRKAGSLTDAEIADTRKAATDAVRAAIRTANGAEPAPADRDLLLDAVYASNDRAAQDRVAQDRVAPDSVEVPA